jgi:Uma2 family endonuclease
MTQALEKSAAAPTEDAPEVQPHRFTSTEFRKMLEHDLVPRCGQLIRGEIYFMAAMGASHAFVITMLTEMLVQRFSAQARVSPQCPVVIWDDSEPEPDFALVKRDAVPGLVKANDVLLAIEVSDTTLRFDRQKKLPDYAGSGVQEAWLLNPDDRQLEVYQQPDGEQYMLLQTVKPETPVAPLFAQKASLEWWLALTDEGVK